MVRCFPLITLLSICMCGAGLSAETLVDKMFSDHMVLQRDRAVPVWGRATAGEKIVVTFRGQSKEAVADKDGKWMLSLDPMKVGEPAELTVKGTKAVSFKDVLVGEVWVGSGQSNMAGGVNSYVKKDPVLAQNMADGPYPKLRLFKKGAWQIAEAKTIKAFSAIHFSFGLALHQKLKVPVGLMVGAVGGTPSGRWLSKEMAAADTALVAKLGSLEKMKETHEAALKKWEADAAKAKAEKKRAPRKPRGPINIGDLYQRHVRPFVPFGIRGVLWDQGESRTQLPGVDQFTAMRALINGWRKVWGQGDFFFLHVQKPSGGGCAWDPANPVNRGAMPFSSKLPGGASILAKVLAYPLEHIKIGTIKNAPLVPCSDLGPGIHPENKSGYGMRACRVALGEVYGQDVITCGPTYADHKVEGGKVRVTFTHVGKGLAFKHGEKLQGFEIAGADQKWVWADGSIDGDAVVLESKQVPTPVHVRYAFRKVFTFANLLNKDGLPALMFSTVPATK